MNNKVLILGQGLLGSEIKKQAGWDSISRVEQNFDFNDIESYESYLVGYSTIVNCIANTKTYSPSKSEHWKTNYKAVYELAMHCNIKRKKLVHISSDFVYANNSIALPTENDVPVHAENWYSLTKLLADNVIELVSDNFLICRCTHQQHPFKYKDAFDDRYGNFDYTCVIAGLIISLINENQSGIFNVGTERKTVYDLVKDEGVKPIKTPPGLPVDTSMSIEKLTKALKL